jgi:hypothetical protein
MPVRVNGNLWIVAAVVTCDSSAELPWERGNGFVGAFSCYDDAVENLLADEPAVAQWTPPDSEDGTPFASNPHFYVWRAERDDQNSAFRWCQCEAHYFDIFPTMVG